MTEQEWLTSNDPQAMLKYLTDDSEGSSGYHPCCTDRQLRLFAWECCVVAYDDTIKTNPEQPPSGWTSMQWAQRWADVSGACSDNPDGKRRANILRDIIGNPWRPVDIWRDSKGITDRYVTPTVADLAQQIYGNRAFNLMPILCDALEETGCTEAAVLEHCRGKKCSECNGYGIIEPTERTDAPCPSCGGGWDSIGSQSVYRKGTGHVLALQVCGCWVLDLILGKK